MNFTNAPDIFYYIYSFKTHYFTTFFNVFKNYQIINYYKILSLLIKENELKSIKCNCLIFRK